MSLNNEEPEQPMNWPGAVTSIVFTLALLAFCLVGCFGIGR